jgi:glycosyltransferase involved in cell wall biosynthesis
LLLPSLQDGLPNTLLEGMACARPVIASSVGGIPDALHDGENGLLVPPGDVDALAAATLQLLSQPDRREQLGNAARATVIRDFSPARELNKNLALYQQLIGRE